MLLFGINIGGIAYLFWLKEKFKLENELFGKWNEEKESNRIGMSSKSEIESSKILS